MFALKICLMLALISCLIMPDDYIVFSAPMLGKLYWACLKQPTTPPSTSIGQTRSQALLSRCSGVIQAWHGTRALQRNRMDSKLQPLTPRYAQSHIDLLLIRLKNLAMKLFNWQRSSLDGDIKAVPCTNGSFLGQGVARSARNKTVCCFHNTRGPITTFY